MTHPGTARHDELAEKAVIGAMLADRGGDIADQISTIITPRAFYQPVNGELYRRIAALRDDGPVEPLTLIGTLSPAELTHVGGAPYIYECLNAALNVASGPAYARTVRDLSVLRDVATHAAKCAQLAATSSPQDATALVHRIQDEASALAAAGAPLLEVPDWEALTSVAVPEMLQIQEQVANNILPGVPTGWSDLDRLLNNLQGGQVAIIAGRPGMGKSTAGRNIAQHNAMRRRRPAVLFSLEMSAVENTMALISAGAGVPLNAIRSGKLADTDWSKIARYLQDTEHAPLFIDDTASASLPHARTVMRQLARRGVHPSLIVWDYVQLTTVPGMENRNRQEQVSELSRGFKLFAKEFDIPVIAVCQLNRGPEGRADKRPGLSDLRESGSLEQDADIVILLHRDDYYDKESPRAGEVDMIVAKNRHGMTDTITVAGQFHLQRLTDMALP